MGDGQAITWVIWVLLIIILNIHSNVRLLIGNRVHNIS